MDELRQKFEQTGNKSIALFRDGKKIRGFTQPRQFSKVWSEIISMCNALPGSYEIHGKPNTNTKEIILIEQVTDDHLKGQATPTEVVTSEKSALSEMSIEDVMHLREENVRLKMQNEQLELIIESLENDLNELAEDEAEQLSNPTPSGLDALLQNENITTAAANLMNALSMKFIQGLNNENTSGSNTKNSGATPGSNEERTQSGTDANGL